MKETITLPMVALRGIVPFPGVDLLFDVKRDISRSALSAASNSDRQIILIAQNDPTKEEITEKDLFRVGVVASIKQVFKIAPDTDRALVRCTKRVRLLRSDMSEPYFNAECIELVDSINDFEDEQDRKAVGDLVREYFENYCLNSGKFDRDFFDELMKVKNLGLIINVMAARIDFRLRDKQILLETIPVKQRAFELLKLFRSETDVLKIKHEIDEKVRKNIDKLQREGILREQLKVISEELNDKDGIPGECDDFRKRLENTRLDDEAREKIEKQIDRFSKMTPLSAESSVCRDYIELVLSLPWGIYSKDNKDLKRAERILERDHYGLEDIKERVVEYLALRLHRESANAPVLCLVGPPGTGKTSIAKSVASALGRKYARMSLGGLHDEAELRGHRKTYIGAMPGRIIDAIKNAGTSNPLIVLDEIDKVGKDYKGDPSSALLEVLDGEQNFSFRDNYLELPYDISKVFFICTANTADTIPDALRDRLEIISVSGYTPEEKLAIAKKYLVKKQRDFHGLTAKQIKFKSGILREIIDSYTREAGVRDLENKIGKICRKALKEILSENTETVVINEKKLEEYLGKRKFHKDKISASDTVGEVTGLAWTRLGGTTLQIEVNTFPGSGKIKLTGNLGKVMEESAYAAYSYIRANAHSLGIYTDFEKTDIHIHIPEGATPKDGPSAGITMTTAMVSALSDIPVRHEVAMTGEITIRGNVLPIGGLKEKVLAARAAGIRTVILPEDNSPDLEELPDYAKKDMEFIPVGHAREVLKAALNTISPKVSLVEQPVLPKLMPENSADSQIGSRL